MRVEVFANNFEIPEVLRTYAESRVGLAVRRAANRLSWVGVRFLRGDEPGDDGRVACQIDVWLRGIGLVTVRHVDVNPYVGVDCAAVRLEQAVVRKLREAGAYAGPLGLRPRRARAARGESGGEQRYGVVVVPQDARPRLSLVPWLRARYGVEQVQTISLAWREWDALVAGDLHSPHLARFKDRLAVAQLCHPEAIFVVGGAASQPSADERPQARREVERVVGHIRSFGMPIEVIGVWVNEHWTDEDCLLESEELPLPLSAERSRDGQRDEAFYVSLAGG